MIRLPPNWSTWIYNATHLKFCLLMPWKAKAVGGEYMKYFVGRTVLNLLYTHICKLDRISNVLDYLVFHDMRPENNNLNLKL